MSAGPYEEAHGVRATVQDRCLSCSWHGQERDVTLPTVLAHRSDCPECGTAGVLATDVRDLRVPSDWLAT